MWPSSRTRCIPTLDSCYAHSHLGGEEQLRHAPELHVFDDVHGDLRPEDAHFLHHIVLSVGLHKQGLSVVRHVLLVNERRGPLFLCCLPNELIRQGMDSLSGKEGTAIWGSGRA